MQGPPTIFLVAPKVELTNMNFLTSSLRDFVAEERAWLESEPNQLFSDDGLDSIVKVAILAYFLSFEDLDLLLGKPKLTVQSFDRFWTLRRMKAGKLSHLGTYAKRVDKTRYNSFGSPHADELAWRLIGWSK